MSGRSQRENTRARWASQELRVRRQSMVMVGGRGEVRSGGGRNDGGEGPPPLDRPSSTASYAFGPHTTRSPSNMSSKPKTPTLPTAQRQQPQAPAPAGPRGPNR